MVGGMVAGGLGLVGVRGADAASCRGLGSTCRKNANCCLGECGQQGGRHHCTCGTLVHTGGPSITTGILVDDAVTVLLNGTPIFVENVGGASVVPPISFAAKGGDRLRVIATDLQAYAYHIDPLWLFCAETGKGYALDPVGYDLCCDLPLGGVFYDKTFNL